MVNITYAPTLYRRDIFLYESEYDSASMAIFLGGISVEYAGLRVFRPSVVGGFGAVLSVDSRLVGLFWHMEFTEIGFPLDTIWWMVECVVGLWDVDLGRSRCRLCWIRHRDQWPILVEFASWYNVVFDLCIDATDLASGLANPLDTCLGNQFAADGVARVSSQSIQILDWISFRACGVASTIGHHLVDDSMGVESQGGYRWTQCHSGNSSWNGVGYGDYLAQSYAICVR